jgi:hypothetical protein
MANNIIMAKNKNKTTFVAPVLPFKKRHKNSLAPKIYTQNVTNLGAFALGIKAMESARVTPKQNESLRRILVKKFREIAVSTIHSLIPM